MFYLIYLANSHTVDDLSACATLPCGSQWIIAFVSHYLRLVPDQSCLGRTLIFSFSINCASTSCPCLLDLSFSIATPSSSPGLRHTETMQVNHGPACGKFWWLTEVRKHPRCSIDLTWFWCYLATSAYLPHCSMRNFSRINCNLSSFLARWNCHQSFPGTKWTWYTVCCCLFWTR